jgi:predicted deacetylase
LAPLYYPEEQQRITFLITVYWQRNAGVELSLHGYDQRADIPERKMLF